jgi:hypothetical protein
MCIKSVQNTQNPEVEKAFLFVRIKRMRRKVADITSSLVGQGRDLESSTTSWTESSGGFSLHHCGCHLPLHAA